MLLSVQLALILAYPFLEDFHLGSAVLGVLSMIAVGLAMWVVRSTPALTLIAVVWGFAYVYLAVTNVWPGSIAPLGSDSERFFELLFLSFTTLTSVGLSDIVPVDAHARSVVILEQVAGVLYVAMVISRLVAMRVRNQE